MAYPSDLVRTKNWGSEVLTDSDLESQYDLIINWVMAALSATTGHSHDGSANNGPKIPITNLTVSSQAQGDLIYASSSSAWSRLGYGTTGQFLKTQGAGANPIWADVTSSADQTAMEAASSTTTYVSPGNQKYHPGMPKAWCMFDGTTAGTNAPTVGYGVTSVTRNSTGNYTINLSVTFSSSNF